MILYRDTTRLAHRFAADQVFIQVSREPVDPAYANMITTLIGNGNWDRIFVALIGHGLQGWTRVHGGKSCLANKRIPSM